MPFENPSLKCFGNWKSMASCNNAFLHEDQILFTVLVRQLLLARKKLSILVIRNFWTSSISNILQSHVLLKELKWDLLGSTDLQNRSDAFYSLCRSKATKLCFWSLQHSTRKVPWVKFFEVPDFLIYTNIEHTTAADPCLPCRPSFGIQIFQYLQWCSRKERFSVLASSQITGRIIKTPLLTQWIAALFGSIRSKLHSPEGIPWTAIHYVNWLVLDLDNTLILRP